MMASHRRPDEELRSGFDCNAGGEGGITGGALHGGGSDTGGEGALPASGLSLNGRGAAIGLAFVDCLDTLRGYYEITPTGDDRFALRLLSAGRGGSGPSNQCREIVSEPGAYAVCERD